MSDLVYGHSGSLQHPNDPGIYSFKEKPVRIDFCCSVVDGKLQLKNATANYVKITHQKLQQDVAIAKCQIEWKLCRHDSII